MIDAVKNTNDSLIPELVLFFQNSTSEQRGSLSSEIKTSQTTSISSQTKSNQPLKPNLYLLNQIANLLNHICYLSNHITNLLNQIVPLPNHIIPLSNHIMMWFGRFFGCRKCSRSHRKWNFQKRKLPVISVSHKLPIRLQCQNHSRLPLRLMRFNLLFCLKFQSRTFSSILEYSELVKFHSDKIKTSL